jgi:diaminopimelate decarboxylase
VTGFAYAGGELHAEQVPLATLAQRYGTPCYVYSRAAIEAAYRAFDTAFAGVPHVVCYAMKANANLAVLTCSRASDAASTSSRAASSRGSLRRAATPRRTVFSGVGKTRDEMTAALAAGVLCFNVESAAELSRLADVAAAAGARAPVSLRVNPDVDPRTHPYISTGLKENKFGVPIDEAIALYRTAASLPSIAVTGIDMHIGSQITELAPYREAAQKVLSLVDRLAADGIALEHIDLGGGLGVRYRDETPVDLADYAAMLCELMRGRRETLLLEPGRRLVADAGVLLTRVEYLKPGGRAELRDRRCGHERSPAARAVRRVARDRSRPPAQRRAGALGRRRPRVRERGLPRPRPPARARARRPARRAHGRCVRHGDELQLQRAPPCVRAHGRRRERARGAPPRAHRRSHRARIAAALTRTRARVCASATPRS